MFIVDQRHHFLASRLVLVVCNMVRTRSGHDVVYTEASYGRAARKESSRRQQKRKLARAVLAEDDEDGSESGTADTSTPRTRTRRKTRGQIRQEEALATPPSALTRVGVTPPIQPERMLRGRMPTCSDYGTSRHFSFQGNGYFFCHACDLWDSLPADRNKNCSRTSKRLGCTAKHTSFSHPMTFRKDYCRRGDAMSVGSLITTNNDSVSIGSTCSSATDIEDDEEEQDGDNDDDDDDDAPLYRLPYNEEANISGESIVLDDEYLDSRSRASGAEDSGFARGTTSTPVALSTSSNNQPDGSDKQVIQRLKEKVGLLQEWNLALTREIKRMRHEKERWCTDNNEKKKNAKATQTSATAYQDELLVAINDVTERHNRRWNAYRTCAQVAKLLWNHQLFQPHLLKLASSYLRKTVFTPFSILREMDLAGGTLSYEGIDVLRRVETRGIKRFRGSIIPSKSEIKRMATTVEWYAKTYCPFSVKVTTKGEAIEFDYAQSMLCITRAFYLDEIGKTRSLSVASSIDGASLSKEGITNYLHMIGSGHIADYLYKWKNLYRFSQQGWEAMNSLIKTFFFRRTSHGGGVKGKSKKSRLIPIARWLQRRLIFLCRIDADSIRQFAIDYPMPSNYRTQAASEEDVYG